MQEIVESSNRRIIISGETNARMGDMTEKWGNVIGPFRNEQENGNGKLLLEFCTEQEKFQVRKNDHFIDLK